VLISDALDNLKAAPKLTGPGSAELPVHVALPPEACNANLSGLRWIARQLGSACAPLSEPDELAALVSGATAQVLLTRLQTDQSDDVAAFEDDAFQTCPDFRLSHVAVPTDADGSLRVSGVSALGEGARDAPTALGLTVSRGGLRANIELAIPPPPAALESPGPLGRLLQVQHTLLTLRELRATFWDPKQVEVLATAAACDAGIASEHSSLLLLSLPEQFCDNEIACPPDHPAHARWLALSAERAKTEAEREEAEAKHAKLHGLVKQLVGRYKEMSDAAVPGWGKPVNRGGRGTEEAMMLGGGGGRRGSAARGVMRSCAMPAASAASPLMACMMEGGFDDAPPPALPRAALAAASAEEVFDDECDLPGSLASALCPPPPALPPGSSAPRPAACMGFLDAAELAEFYAPLAPTATAGAEYAPQLSSMLAGADSDEERPVHRSLVAALDPPTRTRAAAGSVLSSVGSLVGGAARRLSLGGSRGGGGPSASPAPPCPPPKKPKRRVVGDGPWLGAIAEAYASSGLGGAQVAFDEQLKSSPALVGKPSTYIQASECLHACGADAAACADVLFDVLETKLPDFQTCRVVAYHLLSLGLLDEAVLLLELVLELAPAEPHSHTDIAFAKLLRLMDSGKSAPVDDKAAERARAEMARVVAALAKVVTSTEWPARFNEIEWPALILLSWAVAWAEHTYPSLRGSLWPEAELPAATYRVGGEAGPRLDIFVWLGWDTDKTDVDLHVTEPTGEEVYYSHNRSSSTGARVSRDFTQGLGPEVYTLPRAPKGTYLVETNYYASHQATQATGSTSAVIWSVQNMGDFGREKLQFSSVRLTKHKQRQSVLQLSV